MPALNFGQLESLWTQAGGNPAMAPLMAGIALAESGGVPNNSNYTDNNGTQTSWGLWQLSDGTHNEYIPGLATDPAAQAKGAVEKMASQGINAWTGDGIWDAWSAAGKPQWPSAATVQSWLAGRNLPTGGGPAAALPASSTPGAGTANNENLGCAASGNVFGEGGFLGIGSFSFTHCEAKAFVSAMILVGGVVVMGLGTVITVAWGLAGTRAGQAVTGAASAVPGPWGAAAQVAKRVGRAPAAARERRDANEGERMLAETERQQGPIGPRGGNETSTRVAREQRRGVSQEGARRRTTNRRRATAPAFDLFE